MTEFDPKPSIEFYDAKTRREMKYVYPSSTSWTAGWILVKNPGDGMWVTLRKATDRDIEAINKAVVECHHHPNKEKHETT